MKNKNIRLIIFLTLTLSFISNLHAGTKPDSNFKSIHQLQSEEYKKDTVKKQNVAPNENQFQKNPKGIFSEKQPMQTIINFSLMVILILILIIAISIFLIVRGIYKTKK